MTVKEYTDSCIKFSKDTKSWFELYNDHFYTTGSSSYWEETVDNAVGGIYIDWAFHLSVKEIRERAPQEFVNNLLMEIDSCSDMEEIMYTVKKYS